MLEHMPLPLFALACVTVVFSSAAACGWSSVKLGWRSSERNLRGYLLAKLLRLGLLLTLLLATTVAGSFLAADDTLRAP